jgi:hypothetical protein
MFEEREEGNGVEENDNNDLLEIELLGHLVVKFDRLQTLHSHGHRANILDEGQEEGVEITPAYPGLESWRLPRAVLQNLSRDNAKKTTEAAPSE